MTREIVGATSRIVTIPSANQHIADVHTRDQPARDVDFRDSTGIHGQPIANAVAESSSLVEGYG